MKLELTFQNYRKEATVFETSKLGVIDLLLKLDDGELILKNFRVLKNKYGHMYISPPHQKDSLVENRWNPSVILEGSLHNAYLEASKEALKSIKERGSV